MAMDRLSALLPNALKKRGLHEVAVAGGVVLAAQRWLEKEMGMHAASLKARKYAGKTLFIDAADGIALSECVRRVPELQKALLAACPDAPVEGVRCLRAASGR
jgi:predicted nucleic acid-binding Zn ribbon protein